MTSSSAPSPSSPSPLPQPPGGAAAPPRAPAGALIPYGAAVVALALVAVAFGPAVQVMIERWTEEGSYYGHGPLVPFACAWIVWLKRAELPPLLPGSSVLGIPVVLGSVLVLAFGMLEEVNFIQGFALLGALLGISLSLLGWRVVWALWFAFAYAAFMVPLPQVLIANITFQMKILAARASVWVIDAVGIPVALDGSTIYMMSTQVTVDDVCSGLKTLIALVAIAAIFAYLERSRWKAVLTLLLAAPIAIVANVVRILVLCYLASIGSPAAHEGPLHEATGLAVYVVALALLMGIRSLPDPWEPEVASEGDAASPGDGESLGGPVGASPVLAGLQRAGGCGGPSRSHVVALSTVLGLGALASVAIARTAPVVGTSNRTASIPVEVGAWRGVDDTFDERVYQILGTRDVLFRRYTPDGAGVPVDLYVVHAADSRKVAHPPEICFSGGGFTARVREVVPFVYGDRKLDAVRMVLDRGRHGLLVYYWYRIDGKDTANYLDHQLAGLMRRFRRESREGAMIRLSTPLGHGGVEAAEARIQRFSREALGPALAPIP